MTCLTVPPGSSSSNDRNTFSLLNKSSSTMRSIASPCPLADGPGPLIDGPPSAQALLGATRATLWASIRRFLEKMNKIGSEKNGLIFFHCYFFGRFRSGILNKVTTLFNFYQAFINIRWRDIFCLVWRHVMLMCREPCHVSPPGHINIFCLY